MSRHIERPRCLGRTPRGPIRAGWPVLPGLVAVVALALAGAAPALATPSTIPYFDGPDGFGFDNASLEGPIAPAFTIPSEDWWRPAGSKELDDGSFDIVLKERQRVREKDGFFRVKVKLKIRNKTGRKLDEAAVFFPALGGPPSFPDYAGVPIELKLGKKKNQLDVLTYEEGDTTYFFAGFLLEKFKPGKRGEVVRKFKYDIVTDRLVEGAAPAFGAAAAIEPTVVPEPGLLWLALAGLGVVGWRIQRP